MKKTYTKKQITEAIAYWNSVLKHMNSKNMKVISESQLNEGFWGGLVGYLTLGAVGVLLAPETLLGLGLAIGGAYAGHKIQNYFRDKHIAETLTQEQLSYLTAAYSAGKDGIDLKAAEEAAKKSGNPVDIEKETEDLVDAEHLQIKNGKMFITKKGIDLMKNAGFDESKFNSDSEDMLKKNQDQK